MKFKILSTILQIVFVLSVASGAEKESRTSFSGISYETPSNDATAHGTSIFSSIKPSTSFSHDSSYGVPQQGKTVTSESSYSNSPSGGYGGAPSYPAPSQPSSSYGPASRPSPSYLPNNPIAPINTPAQKPEESYAYYYQHYPANSHSHSHSNSDFTSPWGEVGGHSDLGGAAGGILGGVGGLAALGLAGLAALAKGALALKPLLIIGVLLILLLPLLIFFLPIPIITIPSGRQYVKSAVERLTEKVLGNEECLERILCKIPPLPSKLHGTAGELWKNYGEVVKGKSERVGRGLDEYFSNVESKHRSFKCNQKFKCSSKFF